VKKTPVLLVVLFLIVSVGVRLSGVQGAILSRPVVRAATEIVAFSHDILLSTDDSLYAHHVETTMAIGDEGQIFVGWKDAMSHNGGGYRVSMVVSHDGGESWSRPQYMPMFAGLETRQSDPWMVWHNGTLYYAYLEFTEDSGFTQITVARSQDNGSTWDTSTASFGQYFADKETMAISASGTIFVVYDDVDLSENGTTTVRLSQSTDGGATFGETAVIGEPDEGNVGPYIALNGSDAIFVAWTYLQQEGGNLYLAQSTDGGLSFGEPQLINNDGNYSDFTVVGGRPSQLTLPVIRFDQWNRLYVLWADRYDQKTGSFDVYLRYSDDFGATWSDRLRINPNTEGNQWCPEMDIDSEGRIHIVYYDEEGDSYRPYYRVVQFTGENRTTAVLGTPIPVSEASTSDDFTRPGDYFVIKLDSHGIPHVAWTDGRDGEMDIYYAHGLTEHSTTTETSSTTTTGVTITTTTGTNGASMLVETGILIGAVVVTLAILIVVYRKRH